MKLLKYLQKTKGISRRDFESMLKGNVISLNDEKITGFDHVVKIGDKLKIILPSGKEFKETIEKIPTYKPVMVLFNKPKGYTVSKEDKHNKTIFELLPKSWIKDFYYIGRLDKDSRGLLLLTNEPDMVDYYENPKNRIFKIYEVEIDKAFKTDHIRKTKKGFLVDEDGNRIDIEKDITPVGRVDQLEFYDVHYLNMKGKHILRILLKEGKKRHIRRLLGSLKYKVKDLKRIKVGKYDIGTIKEGKYMIAKI